MIRKSSLCLCLLAVTACPRGSDGPDVDVADLVGGAAPLVNSLGYRQSENVWTPAEPGRNLVLTLDVNIQRAAEQAHVVIGNL